MKRKQEFTEKVVGTVGPGWRQPTPHELVNGLPPSAIGRRVGEGADWWVRAPHYLMAPASKGCVYLVSVEDPPAPRQMTDSEPAPEPQYSARQFVSFVASRLPVLPTQFSLRELRGVLQRALRELEDPVVGVGCPVTPVDGSPVLEDQVPLKWEQALQEVRRIGELNYAATLNAHAELLKKLEDLQRKKKQVHQPQNNP